MKKMYFLTLAVCGLVTVFATACGSSKKTGDEESIEDIMKSLESLSDAEILAMGIVQIPEFSIEIDNLGEEIIMTGDSLKPFATIETEIEKNDKLSLWKGVYFLDVLEFLGVDEFTSVIIEGDTTIEYTKRMVQYSLLTYGCDGENINGNQINTVMLDNSEINKENWVDNIKKITLVYNADEVLEEVFEEQAPEQQEEGISLEELLKSGNFEIEFEMEDEEIEETEPEISEGE